MSSDPPSSVPPTQFYFCYQCNRTISLPPPSSADLACPHCNAGFLEEVENTNTNINLDNPLTFFSSAAHPFLFPPSSDLPFQDPHAFNPLQFLQNYLQSMRQGGANIQFVIQNADAEQQNHQLLLPFPPNNLGDYFFGPGFEQLIQQLAENDPNRYWTPPASKSAVEGLPSVKVTDELMASESSQCAVCMDEFQMGGEAKQMPCHHVFHSECILPWLELHNSCPVCRYELPTDDPEYEQRARGRTDNNVGGEGEGATNDRTVERRFSISLPWPFGPPGNVAEGSNSSGGESNPERRENPDLGSETRYEDLD